MCDSDTNGVDKRTANTCVIWSGLHDLGLERAGASQPIFIIAGRRVVDVNPLLVQPAQNLRLAGPGRYSARLMP